MNFFAHHQQQNYDPQYYPMPPPYLQPPPWPELDRPSGITYAWQSPPPPPAADSFQWGQPFHASAHAPYDSAPTTMESILSWLLRMEARLDAAEQRWPMASTPPPEYVPPSDEPPPRTYGHDATGQLSTWDVNFPSYEPPPQPFQPSPVSTYWTPDPPPPPAPEPPCGMPPSWRLPTWDLSVVPTAVHTVSITPLDDPQIDGMVEVCSPEKLGDDAPMAADCSWSDGEGDQVQGMQDLEIPQSLEKSGFGGANWETSHKLHACISAEDMDQSPIDGDQNMGRDLFLPAGSNWGSFLIPGVAIAGVGGLFYLIHHNDEKRAVAKGKGEKFERSAIQGPIIGGPFSLVDTEGRIVIEKNVLIFDPGGDISPWVSRCVTSPRSEWFVATWYPP